MNPRHIVFPPSAKLGSPMAVYKDGWRYKSQQAGKSLYKICHAIANGILLALIIATVVIVCYTMAPPPGVDISHILEHK